MNAKPIGEKNRLPASSTQYPHGWSEPIFGQGIVIDRELYGLYDLIARHHGITTQGLVQDVLYKALEEGLKDVYQTCVTKSRAAGERIQHVRKKHGLQS